MSTIKENLNAIKDARDSIKTAIENKGAVGVTDDITTYANLINNIQPEGGSGDIKLFETQEQMQADPNPQEGDLAVVYREEIQPINEESEFDSCIFPNTVVLSEAFSGNINGSFRAVDSSSGFFDGNVSISSSRFRFNGYGESGQVRVEYESQDGITYTRKDSGEEIQEFGVTIKYQPMQPWNDVFGNFMKIGGKYFDGLYEYKQEGQYGIPYNFRIENNTLLYDIIPFDVPSFAKSIGVNTKSGTLVIMKRDENGDFIGYYSNNSSGQSIVKYNGRLYYANSYGANCSYTDLSTGETTSLTNGQQVTVGSITTYIMLDTEMEDNDKLVYFIPSGNWEYNVYIDTYTLLQPSGGFRYQSYYFADTQFDTTSDYVYEKTFYGKNGIESGNLQDGNIVNDPIKNIYLTIADMFKTGLVLYDNIKFRDLEFSELPFKLDTSNVTIMNNMFCNCTHLTNIPLLDTSRAVNMAAMFSGCQSLTSVPQLDTSNVTNIDSMFSQCISLTTVPQLDTGKVKEMGSMFSGCTSLTSVPQLDTSNVTNMYSTFYNCTNLTTVPVLDLSSVTNVYRMFYQCPSLNNTSLNNILATCITAIKLTSGKTLANVGLTKAQATTCQSLSNWSAFVNAGWTTGY